MNLPAIFHRYVDVDGVRLFYREAGQRDAPTILLLHGFPSSSAQFRRLMDSLGGRYHVIAPDYPGSGYSDTPTSQSVGGDFLYTFAHLAKVVEGFCDAVGLQEFFLYMFDFGGPIGMRVAQARPECVSGLIVQNANCYDDGLSEMARVIISSHAGEEGAVERVQSLLTLSVTRGQYEGGARDLARIAPDGWTLDQHLLEQPGRKTVQVDLLLDYHSNVALYPEWQAWMRTQCPPVLVIWGRNDAFFIEAGAHAYRHDVPQAEVHVLDTGHFALEEEVSEIASMVARFVEAHAGKSRLGRGVEPREMSS